MRIDGAGVDEVEVTLSERNLRTLLSKVAREGSERTMVKQEGIIALVVKCEPDDVHYGDRGYPPGEVHPLDDPDGGRTQVGPVSEPLLDVFERCRAGGGSLEDYRACFEFDEDVIAGMQAKQAERL